MTRFFCLTLLLLVAFAHCTPSCKEDFFRTQSEGDWGDECRPQPKRDTGCLRDSEFSSCFPDGLVVGCEVGECHSMFFTESVVLDDYLPQLGAPSVLADDYFNPGKWVGPNDETAAGIFGSQVTALALTLGFESCLESFSHGCSFLKDLYVCDSPEYFHPNSRNCMRYYGWTVEELFQQAQVALSGCCFGNNKLACESLYAATTGGSTGDVSTGEYTTGDSTTGDFSSLGARTWTIESDTCNVHFLNDCITFINHAFIDGKPLSSNHAFSTTPCA
eukprot:TRINITY_DN6590_c0_g1_i1.p1 TRINITY_DN6590_c0_g1~~TRINITY_DN6590_c0_g1_i1.p1  ORF type:complete len:275 (-),score=73.80 TRINITY_DN6590_c0_g1_i1:46-870(-)